MTIGSFKTSLSNSEKLLKEISLFKSRGPKPIGETSAEFKTLSLRGTYFQCYKAAIKNLDYDILLFDESFIQFSFVEKGLAYPSVRYAYFQNPLDFVSYEEYLRTELDTNYEEVGESFLEEYQQFLSEAQVNSDAATIRYDLDCKNYSPLIHATSHLHIGNSENIRIPCNRIMTPLSFVVFIVKHIYYDSWKSILLDFQKFDANFFRTMKSHCGFINPTFWKQDPEAKEFFLM